MKAIPLAKLLILTALFAVTRPAMGQQVVWSEDWSGVSAANTIETWNGPVLSPVPWTNGNISIGCYTPLNVTTGVKTPLVTPYDPYRDSKYLYFGYFPGNVGFDNLMTTAAFGTTVGQAYEFNGICFLDIHVQLQFSYSNDGGATYTNLGPPVYFYDPNPIYQYTGDYVRYSIPFTAGSGSTIIHAVSLSTSTNVDFMLGQMSVVTAPAPEPSGAILVGAAGVLGILRRRRRNA